MHPLRSVLVKFESIGLAGHVWPIEELGGAAGVAVLLIMLKRILRILIVLIFGLMLLWAAAILYVTYLGGSIWPKW